MEQFTHAKRLSPDDAEAYLDTGKVYLTEGKIDEAERELGRAMKRRPDAPECLLLEAEICVARLEFDKAKSLLRRCLVSNPSNERARQLLREISGRH